MQLLVYLLFFIDQNYRALVAEANGHDGPKAQGVLWRTK
jgi:hypothetical protein